MNEQHFRALESMYLAAPFHSVLPAVRLSVEPGACSASSEIIPELFHAGGKAHGFTYFRLLDDAAFFAAQSMELEYFLNTSQFSLKFLRPLGAGPVLCKAIAQQKGRVYESSAELFQNNELFARGEGIFLRSRSLLKEVASFRS